MQSEWSEPSAVSMHEARFAPAKIAGLVGLLEESGVASDRVLEGTQLSVEDFQDPNTLTSPMDFLIVSRNALQLYGRSDLGVRLGQRLRATSYGMYGYALMCSETLQKLNSAALKYHRLANGLLQFRLIEDESTISWELPTREQTLLPVIEESLYWFLIDLQLAVQVNIWRDVMGSWCVPARVSYAGPQPAHAAQLMDALECPVNFDENRNLLSYPSSWQQRPPQRADAVTAAQISTQCARLLNEFEVQAGVSRRVYKELTRSPRCFPQIDEIASALCMTSRTLRRKLELERTSYSELLASVKKALALDLLRAGLGTEDVAAALGFSDATSFRHAFKKWTGKTPNDYVRRKNPNHSEASI